MTKENQKSPIGRSSKIAQKFRFSYNFYTKSYPDINNLDEVGATEHFVNTGIHEKRFCPSYHFFKEKKPEYAGSISIKKFANITRLRKIFHHLKFVN